MVLWVKHGSVALHEDKSNDNSKKSKMIADRKREDEITEKAITKTVTLMKSFAVPFF